MKLTLTDLEKSLLNDWHVKLFKETVYPDDWEGELYCKTIKGLWDWRELTMPLPCGETFIYEGFQWNGASVGPMRFAFPKWKHPQSTCRHDVRCNIAEIYKKKNRSLYKKLRKFADQQFKKDVKVGGNWWEVHAGYLAVRVGAIF